MNETNKKIKRNNEEEVMVSVSKKYTWAFACEGDNKYKVLIKKLNPKYFGRAIDLHTAYELFFEDLADASYKKYRKLGILEFLQDSVSKDNGLDDSLTKQKFQVVDDCICTVINNETRPFINTGEFIIENYKVNTCFSYMFFENLNTNEQFMYYGD